MLFSNISNAFSSVKLSSLAVQQFSLSDDGANRFNQR